MNDQHNKPKKVIQNGKTERLNNQTQCEKAAKKIVSAISDDKLNSLKDYSIRDLVNHSKDLGHGLADQNVKTNQLRKFLDAINQIKAELALKNTPDINDVEVLLQMLKPKLAYAVGRANKKEEVGIKALEDVVSTAIDKISKAKNIKTSEDVHIFNQDFQRLVNLIEAIIAYHKAAGGKNQ